MQLFWKERERDRKAKLGGVLEGGNYSKRVLDHLGVSPAKWTGLQVSPNLAKNGPSWSDFLGLCLLGPKPQNTDLVLPSSE